MERKQILHKRIASHGVAGNAVTFRTIHDKEIIHISCVYISTYALHISYASTFRHNNTYIIHIYMYIYIYIYHMHLNCKHNRHIYVIYIYTNYIYNLKGI